MKKQAKPLSDKQRVERNQKARARHWRKTGVSEATVQWMKRNGVL